MTEEDAEITHAEVFEDKPKEPLEETIEIEEAIIPVSDMAHDEAHQSAYDADILIAKQNTLEMKLFVRILDDLGYTYKSVNTVDRSLRWLPHRFR